MVCRSALSHAPVFVSGAPFRQQCQHKHGKDLLNPSLPDARCSPNPRAQKPRGQALNCKGLKLSYHNGYIMENQMEKKMENEMETGGI